MLKLQAKCVISILQEDISSSETRLQALVRDFKPLDRHAIVYLASRKPVLDVQAMINRPLAWINSTNMNSGLIYCPMEGRPSISSVKKFFLTNQDTVVLKGRVLKLPINIFNEICTNPLKDQVVTLAEIASFPQVILPNVLNNRHISGYSVNMFLLYAKYFGFQPKITSSGGGTYMAHNDSFIDGKFHDVMTRKADICTGGIVDVLRRRYDYGVYMRLTLQRYITRPPRPVNSYGNISKPFPPEVWAVSIFSILVLAILIHASHKIYHIESIKPYQLAKEEKLAFNFFLFAFAKLTEPDPLPWFVKWSTGRFVVLLWSLLSLFLLMFYTSNLRAYMVMVEYERVPVDLHDVYNRGERVYIYDIAPKQRKEYLEMTGQKNTIRYKVAELAERTGGIYSPLEHQGLHRGAAKDMLDNGAFVLTEDITIPYLFLMNPLWTRENIYILPQHTEEYYTNHVLRKHSPATTVINKLARRAVEMGLVNFWITEHLSTRALTPPKPAQVSLGPLKLSTMHTSQIFFGLGIFVALVVYIFEMRRTRPNKALNHRHTSSFSFRKSSGFFIQNQKLWVSEVD